MERAGPIHGHAGAGLAFGLGRTGDGRRARLVRTAQPGRGPAYAMVAAIVTAGVALWIVFGLGVGLLATALGVSVVAGVARRRNNPGA